MLRRLHASTLLLALAILSTNGRAVAGQRIVEARTTHVMRTPVPPDTTGPLAQREEPVAAVSLLAQGSTPPHLARPADTAAYRPAMPLPPRGIAARVPTWSAPLLSALVPGLGQLVLGHERAIGYLALDAVMWAQAVKNSRDGGRQRSGYRTLAREVARAPFGGPRPDGNWDYYERMENYQESGAFSLSIGGDVVPERDTTTYNGAIWLLARRTYWSQFGDPPRPTSPAYQAALNFYLRRAVRPEYQWSWRNAALERDLFKRTIDKGNDAFRRATTDLGVLIANRVLSSVDAFSAVRLRAVRQSDGALAIRGALTVGR